MQGTAIKSSEMTIAMVIIISAKGKATDKHRDPDTINSNMPFGRNYCESCGTPL